MRDYWVPRFKGELVGWLKAKYPHSDWSRLSKRQLYAIYFKAQEKARNRAVVGLCVAMVVLGVLACPEASWCQETAYQEMSKDELEAHFKPYFEAIVDSIYLAEGADKARKPYGILSVPCTDKADCRKVCYNTVRNNYFRWREARNPGRFIEFLGSRYCPVGAENDPGRLNRHWIKNVEALLNKRGYEAW